MGFECEVAGVIEFDDGLWQVRFESFSAGWDEERVFVASDCEERRLILFEIGVEFGIQGHIVRIVFHEIELQIDIAFRSSRSWSRV